MSLRPKRIAFESTMASLHSQVTQLFSPTPGDAAFMDPFQAVYDLCTAYPKPFDDALFESLAAFITEYAKEKRESIVGSLDTVSAYSREWTHFTHASRYLDSVCEYLNRITAKKRSTMPTQSRRRLNANGSVKYERMRVHALAFLIWKETVLTEIKSHAGNRLLNQIFDFVKRDRDGTPLVDNGVIINTVESFVQVCEFVPQPLQFYIQEFEHPYIQSTREYYIAESNTLISTMSVSEYMKCISKRISDEEERSCRFCHETSRDKVAKECVSQCVTAHKERLYDAFAAMLREENLGDCTLVYQLMLKIPDGILPMLQLFQKHMFELGKDIVARLRPAAQKDPRDFIHALIDLHGKWSGICEKTFSNNSAFGAALDKGFRQIVNESYEKAAQNFPELLSRFADSLLKKTLKSQWTEAELEDKIGKALILFNYLQEKDVFQKFYSRMLGRRLLGNLSASDDLEMTMISGLKNVCGVEYTSKLQRMFTDITLSHDLNKRFSTSMERQNVNLGVDFSILVLTAGSWPSMPGAIDYDVPEELLKSVTRFGDFYGNNHNGRKLSWMYHLCKADVKLTYLDKKYELNLSLHQLSVLLPFNQDAKLTLGSLVDRVKIKLADVRKIIKPLLDLEVLVASNTQLDDTTEISVNMKFSNKRTKLKVSTAAQNEATSTQESEVTRAAVDEDRKLYLQATIVRILKSRRVMGHNQLIQEVIQLSTSRFIPSIALIKKSVEQLIDKGYMERSKERTDQYVYVA
ncbi:Cullin-2 [Chytriomyces hyalinus]|nr:Cullin-2 [Chytriomyces hyalinus]